jgi:hypothetical protein
MHESRVIATEIDFLALYHHICDGRRVGVTKISETSFIVRGYASVKAPPNLSKKATTITNQILSATALSRRL